MLDKVLYSVICKKLDRFAKNTKIKTLINHIHNKNLTQNLIEFATKHNYHYAVNILSNKFH